MDSMPAVPATSAHAPVRRARFTVLDETGRSPHETDSGFPKILAVVAGAGLIALGGFFLRGSGAADLKATAAPPAAPAAAAVSDPSRTQAAWAKEQANLKAAATGQAVAPGAPAPAANAAKDPVPAPAAAAVTAENAAPKVAVKAATPARGAVANAFAAAPVKRQRKASDNPYADPPVQRAAASDNPY
jgi:hypothetical protein